MIATNDALLVDECDPLFPRLADFASWGRLKRAVGRNLSRVLTDEYLVIASDDDYPDYRAIRREITEACQELR